MTRFELATLAPKELPKFLGHYETFETAQRAGNLEHAWLSGKLDVRIIDLVACEVWFRYAGQSAWIKTQK